MTEVLFRQGVVAESLSWLPAESLDPRSVQLVQEMADCFTEQQKWHALAKVYGWLYAQGDPCQELYKRAILLGGIYPSPLPLGDEEARLLDWLRRADELLKEFRLRTVLGLGLDEDYLASYQLLAPETDYFRAGVIFFGAEVNQKIQQLILELDALAFMFHFRQGLRPPYPSPEIMEAALSFYAFPLPWAELYQAYPEDPLLASIAAGYLGLVEPHEVSEILAPYPRDDFTRPRWRLKLEDEVSPLAIHQVSLSSGGTWMGIRSMEGLTLYRLTDGYSRHINGTYSNFRWSPQGEGLLLMGKKGQEAEVFLMESPQSRPRKFAQGHYTDAFWFGDNKHVGLDTGLVMRGGDFPVVKVLDRKGRELREATRLELVALMRPPQWNLQRPNFGPGVWVSDPLGCYWLGERELNGVRRLMVYHPDLGFGHVEVSADFNHPSHYTYSQETGHLIRWNPFSVKIYHKDRVEDSLLLGGR